MATRRQVPTPGWKRITRAQLVARMQSENNPSNPTPSDDEDETFIKKHNPIAEQERSRWCYTATKGGTSKAASKRSRASTPKQEAIYPKPLESFAIMEEAKKAYLEACASGSGKSVELKRNLAHFLAPIQSIAAIESVIRKEKEHMKQHQLSIIVANGHSSRIAGDSVASGSQSTLSRYTFEDGTSVEIPENPTKRQKRNDASANFLHTSTQEVPEALQRRKSEKKSLDVALTDLALERISTIESQLNRKTISLYNALEDILRQSDSKVPSQKSFSKLKRFYHEACSSAGGDTTGASRGNDRLVEIIKSKIDPERFPVVADTFNLSASYKLGGCSSEQILQSRALNGRGSKKNPPSGDPNEDEDDDETQDNSELSAFGFSMPNYVLDSDEEAEIEVVNPLTEEVWGDVRGRILRHRRRERQQPLDDDLLAGLEMPDVKVTFNSRIPKSLGDDDKSDLIHPDDRRHVEDGSPNGSPALLPPNGMDGEGSAEIIIEDEDELLEELDFTPPDTPLNDVPEMAPNLDSTQPHLPNGVVTNAAQREAAELENFAVTFSASKEMRKSADGGSDDEGDDTVVVGGIANGIGEKQVDEAGGSRNQLSGRAFNGHGGNSADVS